MHGQTISYHKSVIYIICQNCRTISIVRAIMKHNTKGKGSYACKTNWYSNSETIWGVRENKFFTPQKGILTQTPTYDLSLIQNWGIYERNIEFVHRLLLLLAILYVPHESRGRKRGTLSSTSASLWSLCLRGLGRKKEPTRAPNSQTHGHKWMVFLSLFPEDMFVRCAHFSGFAH